MQNMLLKVVEEDMQLTSISSIVCHLCLHLPGFESLCKCHHDLSSTDCIFLLSDELFQLDRAGKHDQCADLLCELLHAPVG